MPAAHKLDAQPSLTREDALCVMSMLKAGISISAVAHEICWDAYVLVDVCIAVGIIRMRK